MANTPRKTTRSSTSGRATRAGPASPAKARAGTATKTTRKSAASRSSSSSVKAARTAGKVSMTADTPDMPHTEGAVIASVTPLARTSTPQDAGHAAKTPGKDAKDQPEGLTKKALFEQVTTATGKKKKDVKPIVEATLAALGAALSGGDDLNLPPLGKLRIVKSRDQGTGEIVTLKLRRKGAQAETASAPLAEEDD